MMQAAVESFPASFASTSASTPGLPGSPDRPPLLPRLQEHPPPLRWSPGGGVDAAAAGGGRGAGVVDAVVVLELERDWFHLKDGFLTEALEGRADVPAEDVAVAAAAWSFEGLPFRLQMAMAEWMLLQAGVELPLPQSLLQAVAGRGAGSMLHGARFG